MTKSVYENPMYYEIAFSFRDISAEADVFEQCFRKYAKNPVHDILEIGCGHSPHLEEILRRGYAYTGLEINQAMLDYGARKSAALEGKASFIQADMVDFTLPQAVDFAFIPPGSLYTRSTEDLFSHVRAVGRTLHKGGLYMLDWCTCFDHFVKLDDSWSIQQGDIKVNTHYSVKLVNAFEQLVEETIHLQVLESGKTLNFTETSTNRVLFPQEFLQIIRQMQEWEFIGWWKKLDSGGTPG